MVDMSRRNFMIAGTTSLLSLNGGVSKQVEQQDTTEYEYRGVADLVGPADARPEPGDPFFDNKIAFAYRYQAQDTGARSFIQDGDERWTALPVQAPSVSVADSTEIYESDAGTTIIENTANNPINIQLSPSGRTFFVGNDSTQTVIDQQDTWYEIEGPWDSAHMHFLTAEGDGGMTYTGDVTTQVQYILSGVYTSPSNNATYEVALFKNGSVKNRTTIDFSPPRQDEALALPLIVGFTDETTENMTHTPKVRCTSGTENITINGFNFALRG